MIKDETSQAIYLKLHSQSWGRVPTEVKYTENLMSKKPIDTLIRKRPVAERSQLYRFLQTNL